MPIFEQMKELQEIIRQYQVYQSTQESCALATVVKVNGSAYRRPGARMLVSENGQLTGAISGGCLEGDALRKAQAVMFKKQASIVMYDTTDEDDQKFGVGLGCNGIIYVLIEPVNFEDIHNPVRLLQIALETREPAIVLTAFDLDPTSTKQPGTLACLKSSKHVCKPLTSDLLDLKSFVDFDNETNEFKTIKIEKIPKGDDLHCLVEPIYPPVQVLLFGAGNDTIPVCRMADLLGWEVTVIDGRKTHATSGRFPSAKAILVSPAAEAIEQLLVDQHTVALLMTHNFEYEAVILESLAPLPLPYIGILGPKKKTQKLIERLAQKGIQIPLDRIYGPMGLQIGAEGSEAIALSVLSEVMAVLHRQPGSFLRLLDGPIHGGS
jgi:xanthine dehydrogenase accessory factor